MCVVSNVMDYGYRDMQKFPNRWTIEPATIPAFEKLVRVAKEFDNVTGQPDCELEEKKKLIQDLAKKLGVKINFDD